MDGPWKRDRNTDNKRGRCFFHILTGVLIMSMAGMLMDGCGKTTEREEKVREALTAKYGEEFVVTHVYGQGVLEDYYTAEAYSAAYPDLPFSLNMDVNDGSFMDGYVMKRGTNLIASRIELNLGHLLKPYYVHVQSMFPDSVSTDPELSLEEYLATESTNFFTVYLYMDPEGESPESIWLNISDMFKGMDQARGSLEIYFADDQTMEKAREYVESHASLEESYAEIGRDCHVMGIKYEDGKLDITEEAFLSGVSRFMK